MFARIPRWLFLFSASCRPFPLLHFVLSLLLPLLLCRLRRPAAVAAAAAAAVVMVVVVVAVPDPNSIFFCSFFGPRLREGPPCLAPSDHNPFPVAPGNRSGQRHVDKAHADVRAIALRAARSEVRVWAHVPSFLQLQSVAQRIVDVLPADSVMYRVDMFKHEGRYAAPAEGSVGRGTGPPVVPAPRKSPGCPLQRDRSAMCCCCDFKEFLRSDISMTTIVGV